MKKIKLLSAFGLSEKASIAAIAVVLSALMGIGMTADLIAGEDRQWIGLMLLLVSFLIYIFHNYRSRNLSFKPILVSKEKKYLISIIPSNINLLNSIAANYKNLEKIYLIKDNYSNKNIDEVKEKIKQEKIYSKENFLKVKSINEPENIISSFDDILEDLSEAKRDNILIEVTSGQTLASLTLYHLGQLYGIDVSCLISKYNDENKVIGNSAVANLVKFNHELQ
ncbi:MAG: hypothetical protein LBQ52_10870 [Helicobacteraceae bacterium]|jgi:hypothetical protein|nr:hypothetical protein [Helicobacteraceae bacterium]